MDLDAKFHTMKEMLAACMDDPEYIPSCYTAYRGRQISSSAASAHVDDAFAKVACLKKLDPDVVVELVASHSEFTIPEVVKAMSDLSRTEDAHKMLAFGAQLPLNFKWPPTLSSVEMASRLGGDETANCYIHN